MRFHTLGAAVATLALCIVKCQATEAEDVTRPYEFGFNIEGYQHRHEKKDEKGIIMGEFGFVTGDGIYHITVYATDEDGNFKIIKMKNKYIGLPNDKPLNAPNEGILMPIKVTEMMSNQLEGKKPEGIAGCGGCIIPVKPESETSNAEPMTVMEEMMKEKEPPQESVNSMMPTVMKPVEEPMMVANEKPMMMMMHHEKPMMMHHEKPMMHHEKPMMMHHEKPMMMHHEKPMMMHFGKPMEHHQALKKPMKPAPFMLTSPGADDEGVEPSTVNTPIEMAEVVDTESAMTSPVPTEEILPENPEEEGGEKMDMNTMESSEKKPTIPPAVVMQMINTMKEHGKHENHAKPPMKKPPQMLSHDELLKILYKYNYTLSHHGHHEIGNKGGEKWGEYFSHGRDGVGVNVKYTANQFGFQPNITFRKLSESETPKKETEKILNKLHGYEFKWFYSR